jgi:hypothetical protein
MRRPPWPPGLPSRTRTRQSELAKHSKNLFEPQITSDYWRIWFFVLEAAGLTVQLVNASQAKSLSGRPKTEPTRCGWPG